MNRTASEPSVSVVVAARNEAKVIEPVLTSLLNLDYPDFEVILVDDQSNDGTGEIARRLTAKDSKLSVVTGGDLPSGWVGKSWALHQGVERARGEWLLFTDADCFHHPQSLRVAMTKALSSPNDLVSLIPKVEICCLSEKVLMPPFTIVFGTLFSPARLNGHPKKAVAAGGFLLVKRSVYDSVGGHATNRGSIVEDLRLAESVKQSGAVVWTGTTSSLVVTRQYHSFGEVWEGLSKHAFALMGESVVRATMFVLLGLLMVGVPAVGLGVGLLRPDWLTVGVSVVSFLAMLLFGLGSTSLLGIGGRWALVLPIGLLLYGLIVIHSMVQALRGKRMWKGRQYGR